MSGQERQVAITGTTGLVGGALVGAFRDAGWRVVRFVRAPDARFPGVEQCLWNPAEGRIDVGRVRECEAVLHLGGSNIAEKRWTAERRRELRDSRLISTGLLARALVEPGARTCCFVCASAVGWYGDAGDKEVEETAPPGRGFLADLCRAWEEAAQGASRAGVRVVSMRLGAVLARGAGLLGKVVPIFRAGAGGRVGSGRQWLSWIALPDLVRAFLHVVDSPVLSGPVNAVSPHPVRNQEFTSELAAVLQRRACLPAPAFALRLAFGSLADEVLLAGQNVVPRRLVDSGFRFELPYLRDALYSLLGEP